MPQTPEAVATLERDLRTIFGARLQSLVAYGLRAHDTPAASHDAHHHAHERRLTHTMAVVETLSAADLQACAERMARWHDAGLATPLVLAVHEFADSLDAFPLEFGAMIADHTPVVGRSPFEGLKVEASDVRRACEVQARSHLLHLREGFIETRGRADALAMLIVQSAPAFAALLESIARLQGAAVRDRAAAARHVERLLDASVGDVAALAGVTEISSEEAIRIFPSYLEAVERLVEYVDGWSV